MLAMIVDGDMYIVFLTVSGGYSNLIDVSQDFPSNILSSRLFVVKDAGGGCLSGQ